MTLLIHLFTFILPTHNVQGFRKVEELENYSVAKTDIMKLKAGGFHTLESVTSTYSSALKFCYSTRPKI